MRNANARVYLAHCSWFVAAVASLLRGKTSLWVSISMASHEETSGSRHSLTGADSEAALHRHHRKGHRRSLMHTNIAESMKIKQVYYSVAGNIAG